MGKEFVHFNSKAPSRPYCEFSSGETAKNRMESICLDGLKERYGFSAVDLDKPSPERQTIIERLDYELETMESAGCCEILLTLWDSILYAQRNGIPVSPGCGVSAPGSLVAFLMGITDIDPIKYDLVFEIFLNPLREKRLYAAIEVCERRRDEVADYLTATCCPSGHEREELAGVSIECRGLRALSLISETMAEVNEPPNGEWFEWNDSKTFDLISRGDTEGVCELESPHMRSRCRELGASSVMDVAVILALHPPFEHIWGTCKELGGRKRGEIPFDYPHPQLETILRETYGIFVFQEQIIKAINTLAGLPLAEADIMRRIINKKRAEPMEQQRAIFVKGCLNNEIKEDKAAELFELIAFRTSYTINKSHTIAHALIAYQCAYFKANYPRQFQIVERRLYSPIQK